MLWSCWSSNLGTFCSSKWTLMAYGDSPTSCEHTHTPCDRDHLHGTDTTQSWSGTCRSPCQLHNFQWVLPTTLEYCGRKNKILDNRILDAYAAQDTRNKIWLCIYLGDKILRLCYELCRKHHHWDTRGSSRYQALMGCCHCVYFRCALNASYLHAYLNY